MAQYISIDGVDKQVGSVVEVDNSSRKLVVDGVDFSVKDIADDVAYLGTLSSEYQLEDELGSMAYQDTKDWTPIEQLNKLTSGIYDALADISLSTVEESNVSCIVEDLLNALYNLKTLVEPDEPSSVGDPEEPTEEPDPEEPEEN